MINSVLHILVKQFFFPFNMKEDRLTDPLAVVRTQYTLCDILLAF